MTFVDFRPKPMPYSMGVIMTYTNFISKNKPHFLQSATVEEIQSQQVRRGLDPCCLPPCPAVGLLRNCLSIMKNVNFILSSNRLIDIKQKTDPLMKGTLTKQMSFSNLAVYMREPYGCPFFRLTTSLFACYRIWRPYKTDMRKGKALI